MATIRERRPGVWEVRAFTGRDEHGRPTQVSRTVRGGKKDAQRVAAEMTIRPTGRAAGRAVADVLDQWVEHNEAAWAPSTRRDQLSRAGLVKADPIARIAVARLAVADVDRWHSRLRRAGAGEGSIRNQHLVLRAALAQAVRWGWVPTNVAAAAPLGRRKQAPRGTLAVDDVRRVLEAASFDPAAALALRLAAVTGARRAELAALRWDDLEGRRLTIDSSVAIERHGRRGNPRPPTLRDGATKTANRRTVTLDPATVEAIEALRAERGEYGPWIVTVGERPVDPDRVTAWWRRARRLAGLEPRWRLHDLRHWSATLAIGRGHDLRTVANRLGHANPAMTLRVYAHALDAADEGVAATLAAELAGPGDR